MQNEEIKQSESQHNEMFYLTQTEAMTLLSAARYAILPPEARDEKNEQYYKTMEGAITKLQTQIDYNKRFQKDTLEYDYIKKGVEFLLEKDKDFLIKDTNVIDIIEVFKEEFKISLSFDKVYNTMKAIKKELTQKNPETSQNNMYAFSHYYDDMSLEDILDKEIE